MQKSPSVRREWIEMFYQQALQHLIRLPPCGGSGLKSCKGLRLLLNPQVSLRAEGVD